MKDTTLFGTKIKLNGQDGILLNTYQNKYADTDYFTMATIILKDGNKKQIDLQMIEIVEQ